MALKAHILFYDFVLFPLGTLFLSLIGTTVKFQGTLIQYRKQLNSVTLYWSQLKYSQHWGKNPSVLSYLHRKVGEGELGEMRKMNRSMRQAEVPGALLNSGYLSAAIFSSRNYKGMPTAQPQILPVFSWDLPCHLSQGCQPPPNHVTGSINRNTVSQEVLQCYQ